MTYAPYQYTQREIERINNAVAKVTANTEQATSQGNWVPFYQELSLIIAENIKNPPSGLDAKALQDMKNFKLWLDVAIGANGDVGMHSEFIRTFTNVQGKLRIGKTFSKRRDAAGV